jgi:hypothetical protein
MAGIKETANRYYFLSPSDDHPCPQTSALYCGKWTNRPKPDLSHPLHTSKKSTDAVGNPLQAVALALSLSTGMACAGHPEKILRTGKLIVSVTSTRVIPHWIRKQITEVKLFC